MQIEQWGIDFVAGCISIAWYDFALCIMDSVKQRAFGSFHTSNVEELLTQPEVSVIIYNHISH